MKKLTFALEEIKSFIFNVWVNPDQIVVLQRFASNMWGNLLTQLQNPG